MANLTKFQSFKTKRYTTIDITAINDQRLSWKAKGLHTYLLSKPPEWKVWINDLVSRSTDGKSSLDAGLKELKTYGYVYIAVKKNKKRQIEEWTYLIFEFPTSVEDAKKCCENGFELKIPKNPVCDFPLVDNQLYSNTNISKVSKDTIYDSDESCTEKFPLLDRKDLQELITYWNSLQHTQHHTKPATKVYQKSFKMLNQLLKGSFHTHYKIDFEFIQKHNLKISTKKKYTVEELKEVMDRLNDYQCAGYWPGINPYNEHKKSMKQSLPQLLFNADTHTSIFLWVLSERPVKKGFKAKNLRPDIVKKYTGLLQEKLQRPLDEHECTVAERSVDALITWHKKNVLDKLCTLYNEHSGFCSSFGNAKTGIDPFIRTFFAYMIQRERVSVGMISPKSVAFKYFLKYVREFHRYVLDPNDKEWEELKNKSRRATERVHRLEVVL